MATCDNILFFTRNTKVYIEPLTAAGATQNRVWEIPVLDGFSFSQATNSSEITLAEMENAAGDSRRGKRVFNDSLAPAEWSMSTYVRPFASAGTSGTPLADDQGRTRAVEEVLWALFMGPALWDATNYSWEESGGTDYSTWNSAGTTMTLDFDQSNKSTVGTANIYFRLGDTAAEYLYYKLSGAVVNEATINFDIDGIAMIEWSGMGSNLQEIPSSSFPGVDVTEGITNTANFIRNRLTSMTVVPGASYTSGALEASYDITLTGGSISFSNNITYITPEELGVVNIPFAHVTGTRSISGSFTAYLTNDYTGATVNKSADFWADIKALNTVITHDLALTFAIGGVSGDPKVTIAMPSCHVEVPTHSIEDVISIETNFTALGSCIEATDEATIAYYATT